MANVSLKHIKKTYPNGFEAVKDFNLEIADQEFVVLAGPSGCGKSAVVRMIAGVEEITTGELRIEDHLVNDVQPKDRGVAMVFQNYALYPRMTVYENLAFGLKLRGISKQEIDKRVHEIARILNLHALLKCKPKVLSSGHRHRVAMGRAIICDPKVLLMDEPFSNLDTRLRRRMRVELSEIHRRLGMTIVYETHDQEEARELGSRIVVMNGGVIQQVGTYQELYDTPCNLFVAEFIGSLKMNFVDALCQVKENNVYLQAGDSEVKLPSEKAKKLMESGYDGKTVVIGIRPEGLYDGTDFSKKLSMNIHIFDKETQQAIVN